jgi:formylglycine-generating enzyme required for sulfatase activity
MFSGASVLSVCGWYYSNSDSSSHNVGEKIPNELGIYDMSGNVREWCQDWFDYYDSEELDNPVGPLDGVKKVNRGGAWTTPSENCRNSYRNANFPTEAFHDLGFRLVMDSSE